MRPGAAIAHRPKDRDWSALSLQGLVLYFAVSMGTLPFLNAIWLGELPLLAVPQGPKLLVAGWLRTGVVMPGISALGLSKGSFSPDFVLARPYALAIAYLIPVAGVLVVAWVRTRLVRPYRIWAWLVLVAAVLDYVLTLKFATQPALTVY
ncbi:MAG TPA: hypothetical protein VES36_07170 [Candidatus Limnocylindrales bacterium]|nr:hypothetical protein [Candidatus Limnocylindrales bacterium]